MAPKAQTQQVKVPNPQVHTCRQRWHGPSQILSSCFGHIPRIWSQFKTSADALPGWSQPRLRAAPQESLPTLAALILQLRAAPAPSQAFPDLSSASLLGVPPPPAL